MNAREEILDRVRQGLASAPAAPPVVRSYAATGSVSGTALLELFTERVEDYRADVVRCAAQDVETRVAEIVDGLSVVVPPSLPWPVPGSRVDDGLTATELDRVDAVVTAAAVGVAVTGTVVLDHGPDQGRRAISLVPDLHVCVVRVDQVVGTVPEAVDRLDPRRPQTWISGPSATSDIELNRVEGVHGPRRLVVVLAE